MILHTFRDVKLEAYGSQMSTDNDLFCVFLSIFLSRLIRRRFTLLRESDLSLKVELREADGYESQICTEDRTSFSEITRQNQKKDEEKTTTRLDRVLLCLVLEGWRVRRRS